MNPVQKKLAIREDPILVSAPNREGKQFIGRLRQRGIPYYALTNNPHGLKRLEAMGIDRVITVDTADQQTWRHPNVPIGRIYLFEDSFTLCCRLIQLCRSWSDKEICVVTRRDYARKTYRGLGADRIVFTNGNEIELLLRDMETAVPGER
jgi:hypothetical protein